MRLQGVVRKIRIAFCECAEMVGLWLAAENERDNQLGGFCRKSYVRLHGVLTEIETPARMFVPEPCLSTALLIRSRWHEGEMYSSNTTTVFETIGQTI